ncbi:hypothetical protein F383_37939 [Gossypium arboreum]|uniref:Uncharacterized protein n=1 Tax=Gossypium arboreum TaxID=29729 RepID=A0A0B0MCP9_GOSAR|nr:hypothetical protein F383_37939 [Gossypium arboreum]
MAYIGLSLFDKGFGDVFGHFIWLINDLCLMCNFPYDHLINWYMMGIYL